MLVTEHVEKILSQYQRIAAMSELSISDATMAQFHSFMELLSNENGADFSDAVLRDPDIQQAKPGIQKIFSHGSSLYERYWAHRIIDADKPKDVFEQEYPYYQHYKRATSLEINAIKATAIDDVRHVLMVGSGALPVTSLSLARCGFVTDNLDIDQSDLELGQAVSEKLSPDLGMRFIHSDILNQTDLAKYDVIWLAALVGDEVIKARILDHLFEQMAPGALLVVRTAYNLRTLLYPGIGERELEKFSMKLKIQTYSDNFHSMLIAQKTV